MKKILKLIAFSAVSLILAGGLVSCNVTNNGKEEPTKGKPPLETLEGTSWRLIGIVDVETGDVRELGDGSWAPVKEWYRLPFILSFGIDPTNTSDHICSETVIGRGFPNWLFGKYEINYLANSIHISIHATSDALGHPDECLFIDSLNSVNHFSLQENTLRLYYNDKQNYLKFKFQKPAGTDGRPCQSITYN